MNFVQLSVSLETLRQFDEKGNNAFCEAERDQAVKVAVEECAILNAKNRKKCMHVVSAIHVSGCS
jgi:hypothetical protein